MNRFFSFIAYSYVGYVLLLLVQHHGTRWEFGAYGLPSVLIAPDGWHYLDGAPVEPAILAIVEADMEVPVQLVIYSLIGAWVLLMTYYCRQINRKRQRLAETLARTAYLDRLLEQKRLRDQRKG